MADEMDTRFAQLIKRLANKPPVTDITDEEISEEIRAVRRQYPFGKIGVALREAGYPLSQEIAYGMWEWQKR